MTNESKENLLKVLLNEPNETPGTNIGTLISDGYKNTYISSSTVQSQLTYNNYTIILFTTGEVVLYDNEYNVLMQSYLYISGTQVTLWAIDIDEEGMLYGIAYNGSRAYLVYMNNITQKDAEGNYRLQLRKSYDIWDMITEIGNELGTSISIRKITLKKCPTDSRFIIIIDGDIDNNTNVNLIVINYHVNVGTPNTYEYRASAVGTYAENITQSIYINWEDNNEYVYMFSINCNLNAFDYYTPSEVKYYWNRVDFSEGSTINSILMHSNGACVKTGAMTQAVLTGSERVWFVDTVKNPDTQNLTTRLYLYRDYTLHEKFKVFGTIYCNSNALYINNQLFISIQPKIDDSNNEHILFHAIGDNAYKLLDYTEGYYNWALLITNNFNLYGINLNNKCYKYVYNATGYNGTGYFSDKSVTAESTTLYGINTGGSSNIVPIFARNLYNKIIIGNSIISTVQVPFNYLNNSIILKEDLVSKTNTVIDEDNQEIIKNKYEELYINNIDSYKVFDNNIGSVYNQNSSLELVYNITNGFNRNYKITKYRINYNNGTHRDYSIQHITRNGQNATIEIYVKNEDIDNIQIYDDAFSYAFASIDMQYYDLNKIYKITEHIKVE